MNFLEEIFADRIISTGLWPSRSPDLSPLDFWLWTELKEKVYRNNPKTLEDLQRFITVEINNITPALLQRTFNNLIKRVTKCREVNGLRFEDLL